VAYAPQTKLNLLLIRSDSRRQSSLVSLFVGQAGYMSRAGNAFLDCAPHLAVLGVHYQRTHNTACAHVFHPVAIETKGTPDQRTIVQKIGR